MKQKNEVRDWITKVAVSENYKIKMLNCIFCTDKALLEINRTYLNHDTYTDIITFDNSDEEQYINGEIYISIERVTENATLFKTDTDTELHRVLIHGVLHLCGYKDKTDPEKQLMRKKEDTALALFHAK